MLRSYLLVAWRNLQRNKIFSLINIAGLAIGMAVVFHIYRYVTAEKNYDTFHADVERVYRVPLSFIENNVLVRSSAANHPAVGPMLKQDFPEVEAFTRLGKSELLTPSLTLSYTNKAGQSSTFNELNVYFADQSFFSVFSFPLLEGDLKTSLVKPRSIVLAEHMAKKYFGSEGAINKAIKLNGTDYLVTGVMKDIPQNSHLQFEALASMSSFGGRIDENWGWPSFYTYVKLIPGADKHALEKKFPAFIEKYLGNREANDQYKTAIDLQPIREIHLKSDLAIEQSTNGSERTIGFISLLGIFILAIAWINYINLSTAKSIERAKEVGLRKVSGASRKQLISQFFFDACLINGIALILALIIVSVTIPAFEDLTGKNISAILVSSGVLYSLSFWLWIILTLSVGILMVGLYPALLLSSFNPALVLKGKFTKSKSGIAIRKGLVGFQYVLSIFLIAGTVAISRQIDFMQTQDLGYNKNQVLVMRAPSVVDSAFSTQMVYFKNQIKTISAVESMTAGSAVPGHLLPFPNSIRRVEQTEQEYSGYYPVGIDDKFLSTFEMRLVAGRNFRDDERYFYPHVPVMDLMSFYQPASRNGGEANKKILINETLSRRLGFKTPDDAINQRIAFRVWSEFEAEIIGVVKDYHQVSLKDNYHAIGYFYPAFDQCAFFSARIDAHNLPKTIEQLKQIYQASFPGNAFEYFFLDDYFDSQYKDDRHFGKIFSVLTVLAIIIACLGLLGLAIFSVSQRLKEIGIRKVLGASVSSILILFSKDSIRLLSVSYLIALPLVWYAVDTWLKNFAFHIGMEWMIFLIPPICLLLVSLTTIIVISLKTALMSPVVSLKSE